MNPGFYLVLNPLAKGYKKEPYEYAAKSATQTPSTILAGPPNEDPLGKFTSLPNGMGYAGFSEELVCFLCWINKNN